MRGGDAMDMVIRVLLLGLVVMVIGVIGDARAQAPAPAQTSTPAPVTGNIYAVTYVEVMPTSKAEAATILRRYRDAASKEGGNLRCEVVQRIDQPHQFAIFEIWKDQAAVEAHGKSANTTETREKIAAIRNAPTDQRVHTALSIGPIDAPSTGRGVHVRAPRDVLLAHRIYRSVYSVALRRVVGEVRIMAKQIHRYPTPAGRAMLRDMLQRR